MKHTIYLEMSFDDKADALALINAIEKIKGKAYKPKVTDMDPLKLITELWETRHDEDPPKQCNQVASVDFDTTEKTHA